MCHNPTLLSWSELTEHSIGRKKKRKNGEKGCVWYITKSVEHVINTQLKYNFAMPVQQQQM